MTLYHLRTFFLALSVFSMTLMLLRVHHNQHYHLPVLVELQVSTEKPITHHTCSQDSRHQLIKDTCRQARRDKRPVGIRGDHNLKIVVTDDERKILYCIMAKTGSKSWLHYLVTLADKVRPGKWHFRKTEFMNRAGLNYIRNVEVNEVNTKYKDYFKFIVARHPLQRLASAYYEAILKAGRYADKEGRAPNFTEFASRLDADLYPQIHWSLYQDECQLCHVQYDFVVKMETIDDDSRKLNEIIGSDVNLTVRHANILYEEEAEIDPFRYDHMYEEMVETSAATMDKVLDVYDMDIRSLGYQWDNYLLQSKCDNDDGRGGLCC